jgi:hypothetical protein
MDTDMIPTPGPNGDSAVLRPTLRIDELEVRRKETPARGRQVIRDAGYEIQEDSRWGKPNSTGHVVWSIKTLVTTFHQGHPGKLVQTNDREVLESARIMTMNYGENVSVGERDSDFEPVTFDRCDHIEGPFFYGTKSTFVVGDRVVPGYFSNFKEGRTSNNNYFPALVETAVWGAELATAPSGGRGRGHIYLVTPTGPFEHYPNVTNKKFPGNITQSYRSRLPLDVVGEMETWDGHAPEVLNGMLETIARLREQGRDIIED